MAWSLLSLAVVEILNPLLLISAALFVSVGYILTLLMPVNIDIWAALLVISVVAPLVLLTVRARRMWQRRRAAADRFSWRCILPLFPLLFILPAAIATFLLPSVSAIAHLDLQFPFIVQVFNHDSPYESVIVPGNPSNQYWLLFTYVAAVIRITSLDIYSAWVLVNLVFVLSTNIWIARALLALCFARENTLRLGLLVLFCFCALNLTGILSVLANALDGVFDPGRLDLMLLEGADYRLHTVMITVVHGRGLTPGITAFTASLFILLDFVRGRLDRYSLAVFSAAGLTALAFMPTLAFFIFVALLGGLALTVLYTLARSSEGLDAAVAHARATVAAISPSTISIWFLASLGLAVPLLKYVDDFSSNIQSSVSFILFYPTNIRMVLASSVLLLPIAGLQFVRALRNREATQCFLGFSAALGIALCLTFSATLQQSGKAPSYNHYASGALVYPICLLPARRK